MHTAILCKGKAIIALATHTTLIILEVTPNEMIVTDAYKKKIVVKEIAPDVTAQIFWLKNRQRNKWRDQQNFEIDFNSLSDSQLDYIIEAPKQKSDAYERREINKG